jgi:hypothetical protein
MFGGRARAKSHAKRWCRKSGSKSASAADQWCSPEEFWRAAELPLIGVYPSEFHASVRERAGALTRPPIFPRGRPGRANLAGTDRGPRNHRRTADGSGLPTAGPQRMVGAGVPPNRRGGRSLLAGPHMPIDEPLGVLAEIVVGVEGPLQHLARDVLRHVARPALGGVEGDHAKRVRILATQEIADDRLAIGLGGVGLVIGEAVPAVVVQDQVNGDILRRLGHAAGHVRTHTNKRFNSDHRWPFRGILTIAGVGGEWVFGNGRCAAPVGVMA